MRIHCHTYAAPDTVCHSTELHAWCGVLWREANHHDALRIIASRRHTLGLFALCLHSYEPVQIVRILLIPHTYEDHFRQGRETY